MPQPPTAQLADIRPVVIAPSFNNAATLDDVLDRLLAPGLFVLVVNDGSTDETAAKLARRAAGDTTGRFHVVAHVTNRGKAAALCTGFEWGTRRGYTHAATIDTDGQLDPADLLTLLDLARADPSAMVVGARDATAVDYPRASRFGRRFSNALVWLESGLTVPDSQCGLRVYPLQLLPNFNGHSGHFGFETEVLTRLGWINGRVLTFPVSCRYFPEAERVSHFRPGRDSARALAMHARLLLTALRPFYMHRLAAGGVSQCAWRRLLRWINPLSAWNEVRTDTAGRTRFAAGFAAGVFIANLPLYGAQTALSLLVARRLKLHPLSVVAGSNVSMPPLGPVLIAAAIALGHLVTRGNWPVWADYDPHRVGFVQMIGPLLRDWVVGGAILGLLLGGTAFVGLEWILRAAAAAGRWRTAPAVEAPE